MNDLIIKALADDLAWAFACSVAISTVCVGAIGLILWHALT